MPYTLKGDRNIEYGYLTHHIVPGNGRLALDLGCGPDAHSAQIAIANGWSVIGIDLEPCGYCHSNFTFIQADLLEYDFGPIKFDLIINISTMEHFGLAGRYGVTSDNSAADIYGMQKLAELMNIGAVIIMTIPAGKDTVFRPLHRVYGMGRLPTLTMGYRVLGESEFYGKRDGVDDYVLVSANEALHTVPTANPSYYALGCFRLCRVKDAHLFGKEK